MSPRESWLAARNESGIAVEAIQVLTGYKTGEKLGAAIAPVRARAVRIDIKGSHVHARGPARCCSRRGIPGSSQHLDSCSSAVATWLYPVGAGCRVLKILRDEPRTHCVCICGQLLGRIDARQRKKKLLDVLWQKMARYSFCKVHHCQSAINCSIDRLPEKLSCPSRTVTFPRFQLDPEQHP